MSGGRDRGKPRLSNDQVEYADFFDGAFADVVCNPSLPGKGILQYCQSPGGRRRKLSVVRNRRAIALVYNAGERKSMPT